MAGWSPWWSQAGENSLTSYEDLLQLWKAATERGLFNLGTNWGAHAGSGHYDPSRPALFFHLPPMRRTPFLWRGTATGGSPGVLIDSASTPNWKCGNCGGGTDSINSGYKIRFTAGTGYEPNSDCDNTYTITGIETTRTPEMDAAATSGYGLTSSGLYPPILITALQGDFTFTPDTTTEYEIRPEDFPFRAYSNPWNIQMGFFGESVPKDKNVEFKWGDEPQVIRYAANGEWPVDVWRPYDEDFWPDIQECLTPDCYKALSGLQSALANGCGNYLASGNWGNDPSGPANYTLETLLDDIGVYGVDSITHSRGFTRNVPKEFAYVYPKNCIIPQIDPFYDDVEEHWAGLDEIQYQITGTDGTDYRYELRSYASGDNPGPLLTGPRLTLAGTDEIAAINWITPLDAIRCPGARLELINVKIATGSSSGNAYAIDGVSAKPYRLQGKTLRLTEGTGWVEGGSNDYSILDNSATFIVADTPALDETSKFEIVGESITGSGANTKEVLLARDSWVRNLYAGRTLKVGEVRRNILYNGPGFLVYEGTRLTGSFDILAYLDTYVVDIDSAVNVKIPKQPFSISAGSQWKMDWGKYLFRPASTTYQCGCSFVNGETARYLADIRGESFYSHPDAEIQAACQKLYERGSGAGYSGIASGGTTAYLRDIEADWEPSKYNKTVWTGRDLKMTYGDGTTEIRLIDHSTKDCLFPTVAFSQTPDENTTYQIIELERGRTYLRQSGKWVKPPTPTYPEDNRNLRPLNHNHYGVVQRGDWVEFNTFKECHDAINKLLKKRFNGVGWAVNPCYQKYGDTSAIFDPYGDPVDPIPYRTLSDASQGANQRWNDCPELPIASLPPQSAISFFLWGKNQSGTGEPVATASCSTVSRCPEVTGTPTAVVDWYDDLHNVTVSVSVYSRMTDVVDLDINGTTTHTTTITDWMPLKGNFSVRTATTVTGSVIELPFPDYPHLPTLGDDEYQQGGIIRTITSLCGVADFSSAFEYK